jgi:Tol biopolymer transport system component
MVRTLAYAMGVLVTGIATGGCSESSETGSVAEGIKAAAERQQGGAAFVVAASGGATSESGGQVTLAVRLRHKPKSSVTVAVASDTASEGTVLPTSLAFTRDDWNVAQNVTVTGAPDLVMDGDQPYAVTLSSSSTDHRFSGKTSRVGLRNRDVAPQLQRLELNAFQDYGHRFMAEHGEFFVYAAYPPDVTFDEVGQPSSPGQLWLYDRATETTRLITHDAGGGYADGNSDGAAVSGDGRYIAFRSSATNLGPAVTPFSTNVFIYTRATESIELVSQDRAGGSAQSFSLMGIPTVSHDGRFVAFLSSSALVEGDHDGATDFFVRDREAGTTRLISDSSGAVPDQAYKTDSAISGNGRFLAFVSGTAADPDNNKGAFVQDLSTGSLERADVSAVGVPGNGFVYGIDISDDGRYVAFSSFADNLLPTPSNTMQVFIRDRLKHTIELASVNGSGEAGSSSSSEARLSGDGRFVAFLSWASNLTSHAKVSGYFDLYVHDRRGGQTSLLSLSTAGTTANGPSDSFSLAGDGSTLAFASAATDLVAGDTTTYPPDVFVASVPHD